MSEQPLTLRDLEPNDWTGQRDQIIDLAGRGFTQAYIAKSVGLSTATVARILKSEFQDRNNNRQRIVEAHAQTVQWLKMKITERMTAMKGAWDRRDGELLLKVLEREAKLFGTDQPTQHQVNVTVEDLSDEDILLELKKNGYEVKQLMPPTPQPTHPQHIEDAQYESARSEDSWSNPPPVGPDQPRE